MMTTVLSKDFMYPPLQSLLEKFGPYLEENKEKLSEEELEKYRRQQEVKFWFEIFRLFLAIIPTLC